MLKAFHIAATGMQAQQLNVDTIANNLANVNTTGFKKGKVTFSDLMTREAAASVAATGPDGSAGPLATVPQLGAGVGVASVAKVFDLGDLKQTGAALDVAIRGEGFFEVSMPDGSRAFTRSGALKVSADGLLVTDAGFPLRSGIGIPANATALTIDASGAVRVTVPNQASPVEAGRLELARFANPGALLAEGNNLYRATETSGEPIAARAGEDGAGAVAQGFVEGSNVNMVDEMVSLVVAQRAYEASVKVVQASDEMLALVNGLRK